MAMGNGFAAFVQGFAGGVDTRHKWEDRRREIGRQEVMDGYEAERQKRLADQHGWAGETHGWNRDRHGVYMDQAHDADRLREQEWDDFTGIRGALNEADAAAAAGMGAGPALVAPALPGPVEQAAATVAPTATTPSVTPASAQRAPYSIEKGVARGTHPLIVEDPNRPYAIERDKAAGSLGAVPEGMGAAPAPADAPLLADAGGGKVVATRAPRNAAEKRQIAEAAKAGRLAQGEDAAARQAQIDAAGNARLTESGVANALRRDEDHEWFEPGGAGADLAEAIKLPARGAIAVADAATNQGLRGVRQVNTPINAISRWITGQDFGQPSNVDTLNRNAPDFPEAPQKVAEKAADVAEEVTKVPTPEMGIKPGASLTPEQVQRGAKTYMQSYRETGLPLVTRELMRQGKFEAAEGLRTFVNDAATQDGLNAYFGALGAAQMGDTDAAASLMIDAYNANGYFDDGYQIDKGQTELIKDESGEVTGIKLAMIHQQTGEVFVQEAEISDLIQRGLWLLSPEKAAEQYLARQQEMQKHLMELDKERRQAGAKLIDRDMAAIDAAALELMKTSAENALTSGEAPLTYQEALAEVMAARSATQGGGEAAPADDTPMLHRPAR